MISKLIQPFIWEDIAMGIGSIIGLYRKGFLLKDTQTVMSRKGTMPDTALYAGTALAPLYSLELWFTFFISLGTFITHIGLYLFRYPEGENWAGFHKPVRIVAMDKISTLRTRIGDLI